MSELRKFIELLENTNGVSLIGFVYTNAQGEKTKRLVNINVSYVNALKKDIKTLSTARYETELEEQARIALLKSVILSIRKQASETDLLTIEPMLEEVIQSNSIVIETKESVKHENQSEGQSNGYLPIKNLPVSFNGNTESVYLFAKKVKKTILVEGVYKEVKSRPLTIAKSKIERELKLKSKEFGRFNLKNFEGALNSRGTSIFLNGTLEDFENETDTNE